MEICVRLQKKSEAAPKRHKYSEAKGGSKSHVEIDSGGMEGRGGIWVGRRSKFSGRKDWVREWSIKGQAHEKTFFSFADDQEQENQS